jgi:hypothetical protein
MSPRAKNRLLTVSAAIGALVGALGLTRPAVHALNEHFVTTDTFRLYQAGAALQHQRDSLNGLRDYAQLRDSVNAVSSGVAVLLRACHRSGECRP